MIDWYALQRCPRCFRAWACWSVRKRHASFQMRPTLLVVTIWQDRWGAR